MAAKKPKKVAKKILNEKKKLPKALDKMPEHKRDDVLHHLRQSKKKKK